MQNLLCSINGLYDLEVFNGDHLLAQKRFAYPIQQSFPIVAPDKDQREWLDFSSLDQRDRFEQFVKRSKSARQNDECDRVLHEHHFSYEEIPEVQKLICKDVRLL